MRSATGRGCAWRPGRRAGCVLAALATTAGLVSLPAAAQPLSAPSAADAPARATVASLQRATAANDVDGNKLYDDLDAAYARAGASRRLPVIVSFVDGVEAAEAVVDVRRVAPGAAVTRIFRIVPAYAGTLTATEALAVAGLPQVRQIETDSPGTPETQTATAVMGADAVVDGLGIDGSLDGDARTITPPDVTIAVLDTGFDTNHLDLQGKLEAFVDVADGVIEPYDSDGHGTHVASIAAGWGEGDERYRGVAPGAGIVGLRIENESHAIAGYQWIVANREAFDIRVATISFGFGTASDGTTALERAVDAAWDAGVVCFKSNGNSGPGSGTMTVPAAARGILAMGSVLDPAGAGAKYGFVLSEFSSRGPTSDGRIKPDLLAPGESITAADAGTTSGYVTFSGTSMAAPFGAGTAALMVAANPTLTPDGVRDILMATAEDWGRPGADIDHGSGRIQVLDAVEAALRAGGVEPPTVDRPQVPTRTSYYLPPQSSGGTAFVVEDTSVPVAVTAIADPRVVTTPTRVDGVAPLVLVEGPDGRPVAQVPLNGDRQHHVTFRPSVAGGYSVSVEAPFGMTLDVSYGG